MANRMVESIIATDLIIKKSGSSYGGSSYYGSEYAGDGAMDDIDENTQELFYGEWKNDKRNGDRK